MMLAIRALYPVNCLFQTQPNEDNAVRHSPCITQNRSDKRLQGQWFRGIAPWLANEARPDEKHQQRCKRKTFEGKPDLGIGLVEAVCPDLDLFVP